MKALIYIILFVSTISIGQNEIPLEQYNTKSLLSGERNGVYFKDTNNLLDAYKGVWRWTEGNKELTFFLYIDEATPIKYPTNGTPVFEYSMDLIFGYYVYKENGITLIDTKPILLSQINERGWFDRGGIGMKPTSSGNNSENAPNFYFSDYSRLVCRDDVEVPVTASPGYWRFENATTAKVGLFTAGTIYSNCEMQYLYPNFPSNQGITLTRIAAEAPPL